MKLRWFYTDYCEGKQIPGDDPWEADLAQILHSMDCVLHMPNNFLGILDKHDQCLQFMVENDRSITIDIPILREGEYVGSKRKATSLEACLQLVGEFSESSGFANLLPESDFEGVDAE